MWVFSLCLNTVSQLFLEVGSSFHHLGVNTEKSLDVCLLCTLKDSGSSRAMLVTHREHGAEQGLIRQVGVQSCNGELGESLAAAL